MGIIRTEQYSENQNAMALIFKALGHPARIAIIEHLLNVNACICTSFVRELPLAQPTVSKHLSELKNAGLIRGSIEGNSICYCLNEEKLGFLHQYFSTISDRYSTAQNACCNP